MVNNYGKTTSSSRGCKR